MGQGALVNPEEMLSEISSNQKYLLLEYLKTIFL
jgi:hypothetical protein